MNEAPDRPARWAFIGGLALAALLLGRLVNVDPGLFELADRVLRLVRAFLYMAIAAGIGFGFGRPLMTWSGLFGDPIMAASAATGLGLGLAGLLTLGVGWLGLLGLPFVILVTSAGLALAWPHRAEARAATRALASLADPWTIPCALLLLQPVLLVSAPPVYGDEVTYHVALPQQFARDGAIPTFGPSRYLAYPMMVHALATPGLVAGVQEAPRADQLLFALLTVAFLAAWSHTRGLRPWMAPLLWLASPIVLLYSGISYVPATKAHYQLVLLAGYLALAARPDIRGAVTLGVIAGCFLWTKQVALASCAFLTLAMIAGWGAPRRLTFVTLAVAGLIHLPHLVKNAYHTGDPLFPYGSAIFAGKGWNSFLVLNQLVLDGRLTTTTWSEKLTFAWDVLRGPDYTNFEREPVGAHVIAWLPLALLAMIRRREAAFIGSFGIFYSFLWIAGAGPLVTRTMTPLLPAIALLQAEGIEWLSPRGRPLGAILAAAVTFILFLAQLPVRPLSIALPYLTGEETREQCQLRAWGNVYRVHAAMDRLLPPGTPVLGVYSAERALTHCRLIPSHDVEGSFVMGTEAMRRAIASHAARHPALERPGLEQLPVVTTREEALAELNRRRIAHVLVNAELGLPLEHSWIPLLEPDLEKLAQAGGVTLYHVRGAP